MFRNLFRKAVSPLTSTAFIALATYTYLPYFLHKTSSSKHSLFSQIHCLTTQRVNKPQLINHLAKAKQQLIILIYNRQSQQQLTQKIIKYQQLVQRLGINKVLLVDQTDIRHLQTFAKILREDIEQYDRNRKQPVNLQGKIKIFYVNPTFDSNKPFTIQSPNTMIEQIKQIRSYLKINPSKQQLQKSINTYNRTTVVKNCYNQTCIDQYAQKVRQLIQLQLLRDRSQNYLFYVTTNKNQANKISSIISQNNNKQQIYTFRNDILGKTWELYSQFAEQEGSKYQNANKFMMMIKPRVHFITRKSLNTDLYWFVSCVKASSVPVFSINNTINNMPIKISNQAAAETIWLKGHPRQIELLRRIKQKYGNNIQLLIIQNNSASQLIRHVYQPERYCMFSLTPQVPYPKLLIKPPTLNMNLNIWQKFKKINENDIQPYKPTDRLVDGDDQDYDQKWNRVLQKIDKYLKKPQNYSTIKLFSQKQQQINAQKLKQLLTHSQLPQQQKQNRWIFRICGKKNNCMYSTYEKYGIDISTPVYKIDAEVQNVNIDQADYQVIGDSIKILS